MQDQDQYRVRKSKASVGLALGLRLQESCVLLARPRAPRLKARPTCAACRSCSLCCTHDFGHEAWLADGSSNWKILKWPCNLFLRLTNHVFLYLKMDFDGIYLFCRPSTWDYRFEQHKQRFGNFYHTWFGEGARLVNYILYASIPGPCNATNVDFKN